MAEAVENAGGVETPVTDGSAAANTQQAKDLVAYETYRKTVDAEKKAKQKNDELARKLKEYEEKEMAAQGKTQELVDSLRTSLKDKETKFEKVVGSFAYQAVASSIKAEAIKQGCLDVDLLLKAGVDEFSKIEVDAENGFSVNGDDLKRFFEATMTKHPMLFKRAGARIHDMAPATGGALPAKSEKDMTSVDYIAAWKNLENKVK